MTANAPGPKRDRYQIESVLLSELKAAAEQRKQAVEESLPVTNGAAYSPSDGALAIDRSSAAKTKTFKEYEAALKRFTDFVVKGIVPDDLK